MYKSHGQWKLSGVLWATNQIVNEFNPHIIYCTSQHEQTMIFSINKTEGGNVNFLLLSSEKSKVLVQLDDLSVFFYQVQQ